MKRFLFYLSSIISAWLLVLPITITASLGRIQSVEGLFRHKHYWNSTNIIKLIIALIATALCCVIIIKCVHLIIRGIPCLKIRVSFFEHTCTYNINFFKISKYKWIFPAVTLLVALLVTQSTLKTHNISFGMRWFEEYHLVAHAAGGIDLPDDRRTLTNTKESFELNYDKGHRVFEIDMYMTADNIPVAEHDWLYYYNMLGEDYENEEVAPPVYYNDFMKNKYHGKYTPLDVDRIIDLMLQYKDAYIMTDFKHWFDEEKVKYTFKYIVDAAYNRGCPEVLDRIIVQVYHYDFFYWVNSVHQFDNYLFTCYATPPQQREIHGLMDFCKRNNIEVITIPLEWFPGDYAKYATPDNIRIYVHTENSHAKANEFISNGASGIYTDFLTTSDVAVPEMNK